MSTIDVGRQVFFAQSTALKNIGERLNEEFDHAVSLILDTPGRVIISGMGKSGIIGNKIAATLASTGTPSFSVHPAEAYHGDLGMFTSDDIVILISYSGETEEVIRLIPSLKSFGVRTIALVGKPSSTVGRNVDVVLNVAVQREVCPNNLAPTTSTTATLAMGDALAVALIGKRDFKPHDFAVFHPGGSLGRRLLTKVKDVMHRNSPSVSPLDDMKEVIMTMTRAGLGLTVVLEGEDLVGVITDGDLRRALFNRESIVGLVAQDIMTKRPLTIDENELFQTAEDLMFESEVTALLVVNSGGSLTGVVKIQDASKL